MNTSHAHASFLVRFAALVIDAIVVSVVSSIFSRFGSTNMSFVGSLPGLLVGALYYILMWTYWNGQTLGKKALSIKVVRTDGKAVDLQTSLLRYVGYLVSGIFLCLGFIWVLFDERKQGWHDKIANTFVVKA